MHNVRQRDGHVTDLHNQIRCFFMVSCLMFSWLLPTQAGSSNTSPNNPDEVGTTIIEIPVPFDCSRSLCGCWSEVDLKYATTVIDESGHPLQGIQLQCDREPDSIAVSDKDGNVSFAISTMQSPGCGYRRCNHLVFSDTGSNFEILNTTFYVTNNNVTVLRIRE